MRDNTIPIILMVFNTKRQVNKNIAPDKKG